MTRVSCNKFEALRRDGFLARRRGSEARAATDATQVSPQSAVARVARVNSNGDGSVCARDASALDRPRETGGGARGHIMARACTGAWSCCGALAALCLLCLCPEACFSQAAHEIPAPRRARELSFTHGGRNVSALERALAQKEERELAAAAAAAPSSPGEDGTARWCATERLRPCPKNARALEVDDDGIGELRRQLARGYDVMLVGGAFQAARARTHTHTLAPRTDIHGGAPRTDIHGGSQTRSRANGSRRSRAICR